jgi:hypothetical protein
MDINRQAIGTSVRVRNFGSATILDITKDYEDQHYSYWNVKVKLDNGNIIVTNNSNIV